MLQNKAIQLLTNSLRKDPAVQSIFLKGSFGRGEEDPYADIDIYVIVEPEQLPGFLTRREHHARAYRPILVKDEIDLIAPQLIVVYDDFLHVDLFTVTESTLNHYDSIHVLYDPNHRLRNYESTLRLEDDALYNHAFDAIWFFFKYTKARDRGNAIWATEMLRQGMVHFAYVLAAHYFPQRTSLGLKDLSRRNEMGLTAFYEDLTPSRHPEAARVYSRYLSRERPFLLTIPGSENFRIFLNSLLDHERNRSND